MNPFSFNTAQVAAALPVTGNMNVVQPAVQFPAINPRGTLQVNSTTAASVTGTLYVGPQQSGPFVAVGTFTTSSTGNGNTTPPDSGAPENCPGVWWMFEITSATGDTTATINFFLEG